MNTVIRAEGLAKKYVIGQMSQASHATLRDEIAARAQTLYRRLAGAISRQPLPQNLHATQEFWALRDVNFDICQGERVGIIGRNGAGKSTLLKLLSRITEPTHGKVEIRGRVASLLEVGTGFHPELTGRENIFLNGAVLGMARTEIKAKFDEIVAFAEIEQFLDTPVKRYSSGMYVRLAFAVAAHLDPDVLIVDEVLAVGDYQFQKKCIGKMADAEKAGRTVVFVSHNMSAILSICPKAIWIDRGTISSFGETRAVIGKYLADGSVDVSEWSPLETQGAAFRYHKVAIYSDRMGEQGDGFSPESALKVSFEYSVTGTLPPGRLALSITNQEGTVVLATTSTDATPSLNQNWLQAHSKKICTIPGNLIPPGWYQLNISEPTANGNLVHEGVLSFRISELGSLTSRDGRQAMLTPLLKWQDSGVDH